MKVRVILIVLLICLVKSQENQDTVKSVDDSQVEDLQEIPEDFETEEDAFEQLENEITEANKLEIEKEKKQQDPFPLEEEEEESTGDMTVKPNLDKEEVEENNEEAEEDNEEDSGGDSGETEKESIEETVEPDKRKEILPETIKKIRKEHTTNLSSKTVNFKKPSHRDYLNNYWSISQGIKKFEAKYLKCIEDIDEQDYNERSVQRCVGKNLNFIDNDFRYIKMKIISKVDMMVNHDLNENCYKPAKLDKKKAKGCDIIKKDIMDLLWNEYNYPMIIEAHRDKYTFKYAEIEEKVFEQILHVLNESYEKSEQYMEEIYNHREVTFYNIKRAIDMKSKGVIEEEVYRESKAEPVTKTRVITMKEFVHNPNEFDLKDLPHPTFVSNPNEFGMSHFDPYYNLFKQQMQIEQEDLDKMNEREFETNKGPTVYIPDRQLKSEQTGKITKS